MRSKRFGLHLRNANKMERNLQISVNETQCEKYILVVRDVLRCPDVRRMQQLLLSVMQQNENWRLETDRQATQHSLKMHELGDKKLSPPIVCLISNNIFDFTLQKHQLGFTFCNYPYLTIHCLSLSVTNLAV